MIFTKELIGHMIEVIEARNQDIIGIRGKVVNETKYTLQIKHNNEIKTIMKRNTTFRVEGKTIISGSTILKRPEDRLKG